MPLDNTTGFNADMPAIWMLNAQIPRTLQYGASDCNCWESGCGEFDIMEVLSSGAMQCKSTLHTNTPAGDSDYIERPTESTIKVAVIFDSSSSMAQIQVLDDSTVFGPSFAATSVTNFLTQAGSDLISRFAVSA